MISFFQHRKSKWFAIAVIFSAMLAIFYVVNPVKITHIKPLKGLDLEGFSSAKGDNLNSNQLKKLIASLKVSETSLLENYLDRYPGLFNSMQTQIDRIKIDDNDSNYYVSLLEFLFELRMSEKIIKQSMDHSDFDGLVKMDMPQSFDTMLKHAHTNKYIEPNQERLLAEIVKIKAVNLPENSVFDTRYFVTRYKHEKSKQSQYGLFTKGLLQASWLSQAAQGKGDLVDVADDFKNIRKKLETPTDLLRLINHKNESVVINAANLIQYYLPKNAIHVLRFQLIRTNSAEVKMALLDALSAYGTKARMVTKQLKKMIKTTNDNLVREKITQTINSLNGKFTDPKKQDT